MRTPASRSVLAVALATVVFGPIAAEARPFTAGAGIGRIEAERDWDGEPDSTLQLFGRLGLAKRVSAQLELQKIETTYGAAVRSGTALLVVEMGQSGRLVPTMFAGLGIDRGGDDGYGYSQKGSHIEGGLGLEYRFDGGLSLMADIRLGGRSVDDGDTVILDAETTGVSALYAPVLIEGEYRSVRIGVAIRL